jgi:uncharacterized protein YdeI (YjbR/CyaY-like superfamily)
MQRFATVDDYVANSSHWQKELRRLRNVLCATPLAEGVKWGAPCYTYKGKNVVGIGALKSYFGLWFHQGALLKDDKEVLFNAQEGKTKALRQWRMTSAEDIKATIIRRYVKEAISRVDAGRAIKAERSSPIKIPPDFQNALRRIEGATQAFGKLRPGLQREYAAYVASAKREETKRRRIAKILPMIIAGTGLNDRYRR